MSWPLVPHGRSEPEPSSLATVPERGWVPMGEGDLAALVLTGDAPEGATPAAICVSLPQDGVTLDVFGFPQSRPRGQHTKVVIAGDLAGELIQVDDVQSRRRRGTMTDLPVSAARPGAVGVVRWQTDATRPGDQPPPPDDESFGPASPRHASPQHGFWRRTVDTSQHALTSSSEALAIQIDLVAERMLAALEQRRADREHDRAAQGQPEPAWEANEIEVSFGLELANEVDVFVFTSGATASANVTLKFTRTNRP